MKLNISIPEQKVTDNLKIEVASAAPVGGSGTHVGIAFDLPAGNLPQTITAKKGEAAGSRGGLAHLTEGVTLQGGSGKWSAWVQKTRAENSLRLALRNDLDDTGSTLRDGEGSLDDGQKLVLTIPLKTVKGDDTANPGLTYQYGDQFVRNRVLMKESGTLTFTQVAAQDQPLPKEPIEVKLFTEKDNPTALEFGDEVTIKWTVKGGASGTLSGPLPGGRSSQELSKDEGADGNEDFLLAAGKIKVSVVGLQIYQLQAVVKAGEKNISVTSQLVLDVKSPEKYGHLQVTPNYVLPYGELQVKWYVEGVTGATLVGSNPYFTYKISPSAEADGYWDNNNRDAPHIIQAPAKEEGDGMKIDLLMQPDNQKVTQEVEIRPWYDAALQGIPSGDPPLGLAYNKGFLALCTAGALLLAKVGKDDDDRNKLISGGQYGRLQPAAQENSDRWLAVTAFQDGFAALRRLQNKELELVTYNLQRTATAKVTLPSTHSGIESGQLLALADRLYFVSASISLSPTRFYAPPPLVYRWQAGQLAIESEEVPELAAVADWDLLHMAGGIVAWQRESGTLLRFSAGEDGRLNPPYVAGESGDEKPPAPVAGVPLVVNDLLLLVGSGSGKLPQDWVYNAQYGQDSWSKTGHGLNISMDKGRVAYNGDGNRLYAVDGQAVGEAGEHQGDTLSLPEMQMLAADYLSGNPLGSLETPWTEQQRKEMVFVPAGEFLYGSGKKKVDLPAFYIDKTPVTNAEYQKFIAAKPAQKVPDNWDAATRSYPAEKADHPVVYVTWDDAKAYADWAGAALPTEQEWEKAARGTDGRVYPWGNEWQDGFCNTSEAGIRGTTPVGQFSPEGDSPYGCVDMAGNVWELTASWWDDKEKERVVSGGSWYRNQYSARSASRSSNRPAGRYNDLGFRLVVRRPPSS